MHRFKPQLRFYTYSSLVLQDYIKAYLINQLLVFAFALFFIYNPLTIFIFCMEHILRRKKN